MTGSVSSEVCSRIRGFLRVFIVGVVAVRVLPCGPAMAQTPTADSTRPSGAVIAEGQTQSSPDSDLFRFLSPTPIGVITPLQGGRETPPQLRGAQNAGPPPRSTVSPPPVQPQTLGIVEKFGAWTLNCARTPNVRCELGQRTLNPQTGASILWIEIARDRSQKLGSITFATPLGVDLTSGLRVLVDNDEAMRIKFLGCIAIGCLAQPLLTQRFLDRLSQASLIRVSIAGADGRPATLQMPTAGFAEGYIRMAAFLRQEK